MPCPPGAAASREEARWRALTPSGGVFGPLGGAESVGAEGNLHGSALGIPCWVRVSKKNQLSGGPRDASLNPGPTCVLPDWKDGAIIYLCNMNGIYKSTDSGRTFKLVCGSQVK